MTPDTQTVAQQVAQPVSLSDEIAINALNVARSYVVALKESKGKGGDAYIDAAGEARRALDDFGLSNEVKRAVLELTDETARLARSSWETSAENNARLTARASRFFVKSFVVFLYLVALGSVFINVYAVFPVLLVVACLERLLLNDSFVLSLICATYAKLAACVKGSS